MGMERGSAAGGRRKGSAGNAPFLLSLWSSTPLADAPRTCDSPEAVWNRKVSRPPPQGTLLGRCPPDQASIEPSAFAQTAVIQEDDGREGVASTAQPKGIFGLIRVESPKPQQSATFLAQACSLCRLFRAIHG